jgi:hypothetical protein
MRVRDGRLSSDDLPDELSEIFLRAGVDSRLSLDRLREIRFLAQWNFVVIFGRERLVSRTPRGME